MSLGQVKYGETPRWQGGPGGRYDQITEVHCQASLFSGAPSNILVVYGVLALPESLVPGSTTLTKSEVIDFMSWA